MNAIQTQRLIKAGLAVVASVLALPIDAQTSKDQTSRSEPALISSRIVSLGQRRLRSDQAKKDELHSVLHINSTKLHPAPREAATDRWQAPTPHFGLEPKAVAHMIAWIDAKTGWGGREPPTIRFIPHAQLDEMYFGGREKSNYIHVHALYSDESDTIYLSEDWRPDDLYDRSALLHELVHHLQALNKINSVCPADSERKAYHLQIAWLHEQGVQGPYKFLKIDERAIYVISHCPEF